MPNTTPIKPTPSERRKAATLMMARSRQAFTDVCSGCRHKERHTREIVLPVSLDPTDPWKRIPVQSSAGQPPRELRPVVPSHPQLAQSNRVAASLDQ